ncbi:hypothetical protein EDD17DRAFT_1513783 [Pisolithus thermaeus]|nr:hypothetical protein EDD17DRAFT_1513783 [Pisolithus thermaeus]
MGFSKPINVPLGYIFLWTSDFAPQLFSDRTDSQGFRIAWAMTRAANLFSAKEIDAEGRSSLDISLRSTTDAGSRHPPSTDVKIPSTKAARASEEVEGAFISHLLAQGQ